MSELLPALGLFAMLSGWVLYVLFLRAGIWRKTFWESIAPMTAGTGLAVAGAFLAPSALAWITLAVTGAGLALFVHYTRTRTANPACLRLRVGDPVPLFGLPDQAGRIRSFDDLTGPWGLYLVIVRGAW